MKSAVSKGGPASTPVLSHIPLPRRKSSSKGEKSLELNDTDSELGHDPMATRSQAKISLLGGSSFCCASGQKEDYLSEARFLPSKKKPPQAVTKQVHDISTPNSPLVPPGKALLKKRRGKIIEANSEDTLSLVSESGLMKLSHEDIKIRPSCDSRLRPPDQRSKNTPSSPQRKISKDPLPFQKELSEARKAAEANKKLRKDASPRITIKVGNADKKCKESSINKCQEKKTDSAIRSCDVPSTKSVGSENSIYNGSSDILHPNGDVLSNSDPPQLSPTKFRNPTAVHSFISSQESEASYVSNGADLDPFNSCEISSKENFRNCVDIVDCEMENSHNSEDFDCPCCDRTPTVVDGPMSNSDMHIFKSCEVVSPASESTKVCLENFNHKERVLQQEVNALREDLQVERQKLKSQQDRVLLLEEELTMMGQLKNELEKEKELRKIAEDKLLEVLDHEKRIEAQRRETEKHMESRGTQKDDPDINASESSPLIMGYESRVRRYQTYISKLEKDNLMLVNELKKFKDMSPGSQEDQAKLLIEKLGEIQRSSHQQQLQYESCLDEVANRLVHTLLVQKRLEEECKVLHLRVEQLEQENGTLMELIDDDKNENVITSKIEDEVKSASINSEVQNRPPSYHQITSSPIKKKSATHKPSISSDEKPAEPLKSTNACPEKYSESKSFVTSPVSPTSKMGCASKIPAFNSSKPTMVRKKSKAETSPSKVKSEIHPKESTSPSDVQTVKSPQSILSPRVKMSVNSESSKGTSVKRKRLSRNVSPIEKGAKDSKQRIKSSHKRWEHQKTSPEEFTSLCKSPKGDLSPIQSFPRHQQIWSFNCKIDSKISVPECSRKIADSINICHNKLDNENSEHLVEIDKQNLLSSDASASVDCANRTRDEGYSTMSSDLQPDSTNDSIAIETEHSTTYIISEKELPCASDDSVTECLDGSMCSSSDSGFGPLNQVANNSTNLLPEDRNKLNEPLKHAQEVPRNISTVRHKDQIASVKPTIRNNQLPTQLQNKNEPCFKPSSLCDNFMNSESNYKSQLKNSTEELKLSPLKARDILKKLDASLQTSSLEKPPTYNYASMLDYWNCTNDILDLSSHGKTWHFGSQKASFEDQLVFCSKQTYVDDSISGEKVKTAEKSTLTEPEEEMWREKALAPFIDESIWSLYSSEGDIQVKHFPLEPLLSEPSLDKLISHCSPCIIITEDVDGSTQPDLPDFTKPLVKTSNNSSVADIPESVDKIKSGLERVASDTILYLKDAIHELEDSMHRGLKSSKNLSSLHNSGSESETSPSSFKPELLLNLETAMIGQSHLAWPSPTRSSSTSSLQSSTSLHVISDEMEDIDLLQTSRKGSRDPDLSSASDAEYENLEHKDFVERWLQTEMAHSHSSKMMVPQLEPVEEAAESPPLPVRRKSSLPSSPSVTHPRARFMSYPQSTSSFSKFKQHNKLICGSTEDIESKSLDSETKEFNGDFYKLCSVGSLKSLDHFSPAKSQDTQSKRIELPCLNRKTLQSRAEKPKPTGLVKPTRPVTLVVNTIPQIPEHFKTDSLSPQTPVAGCTVTNSEQNAKSKQVPSISCHSVFQKKSSPNLSLPITAEKQNRRHQASDKKSPTKIVFKCSSSPKRQHSKRNSVHNRQNHIKEGCGTAWIHLQANDELSNPMARISLLDSLKVPTSSSGSSSDEEDVLVIQTNSHLQRICQERRHKVKASANYPILDGKKRSSIMGRRELFYRFGDKEREAIACFDFLEELPTASLETLSIRNLSPHEHMPIRRQVTPPSDLHLASRETLSKKERISLLSPTVSSKSAISGSPSSNPRSPVCNYKRINLWNQPLSHMSSSTLNSQDCELLDHISLSDSCAESYSSTPDSFEEAS